MMYLEIVLFGSACFLGGWAMKSIAVSELLKRAKTDIKYIDTLTRKAYKKGYTTALGYKGGIR
uniref:Uncharacterized protein n=1 Tax=Siphoviridae sp. ctGz830 TaxID=2827825 RepID=A0A8S5TAG1_9CAUD|nr:MAG TPA: hypothetical protein [Siphoviridae sp. ctGz830]